MKKLTIFEEKVYNVVRTIPMGEVRSYKWVAQKVGMPRASRAVGNALAKNPYPLIVPCHRVVCSYGRLGEYRWGKDLKKKLLKLEKNSFRSCG